MVPSLYRAEPFGHDKLRETHTWLIWNLFQYCHGDITVCCEELQVVIPAIF